MKTHKSPVVVASSILVLSISGLASTALSAQEPAPAAPPQTQQSLRPANTDAFPDVVARIKGQEITKAQLLEEAAGARAQLAQMGAETVPSVEFYRMALDQILAGILMSEAAQTKGIAATDEEVEQRLSAARAQFASDEEFQQALAAQGDTLEGLSADIRMEISTKKYIQTEIAPTITVTDEELKIFYDQNLESMREPAQIKLRHILILVPQGATPEEKEAGRQVALDVLSRIQAGEDFAALAAQVSDDKNTKDSAGELPWMARNDMPPDFAAAAFALQAGELGGPLESPVGYHVVQSVERKAERTVPFDEAKPSLETIAKQQILQLRIRQVTDELKTQAGVETFL